MELSMEKKIFLITGANGALGKAIIKKLNSFGYKSIGVVRSGHGLKGNSLSKMITPDELYGLENEDISSIVVIHTAFPRSSDAPSLLAGVDFARSLFERLYEMGVRNYINISSQSIYDSNREHPARETDILFPRTSYGIYKAFFEYWIDSFQTKYEGNYCSVRLGSLVGIDMPQRITTRWIKSALAEGKILYKESDSKFSYLHIDDAADGIIKLASINSSKWTKVLNIGANEVLSITEIAYKIIKALEKKHLFNVKLINSGPGSFSNNTIDTLLMERLTSWVPRITLDQVIDEQIRFELTKQV